MAKRMIFTVGVLLAIVAALGFVKFKQIQVAMAEGAAFQPPPEAVTTVVAQEEQWPATLSVIGTVAAVQGVTVSADLPGIVDRISFESGRAVSAGEVLVQLDTRQERAQLTAVEAQRDLARIDFGRMQDLLQERVVSRAEYDRAVADQRQSEARVEEILATIERKTIRAPFTGILGIRQVDRGQYLSAGDAVVSLQSLNPIYVNFGVPQQSVAHVDTGRRVNVTSNDLAGAQFIGG
jgi:membrane fusion protein (multidrug efflux system)